jgi:anti-sigma regulatory factor (Ser/Thr protein kinase)
VTMMTDDLQLTMLASKAAAGLARTLVAERLRKWGCTHIADAALLVTAELIANAAEAVRGKEIKFRFSRDATGVLLEVWDSSPLPPTPKPAEDLTLETLDLSEENWDNNGGWGLPLVQALATECGYTPAPTGGKWVWAQLKI